MWWSDNFLSFKLQLSADKSLFPSPPHTDRSWELPSNCDKNLREWIYGENFLQRQKNSFEPTFSGISFENHGANPLDGVLKKKILSLLV